MSKELRILMVEDRDEDALLVQRELRRQGLTFTARRADSESTLRCALDEFPADLVLSDLSMPGFSGTAALAIVQEKRPDVPFIFVSGTIGEEQAVDLLKLGATDYVLKKHLNRLPRSITRALREVQLEQKRRHAEENYRGIFDNAVLGIYQITPEGYCLAINHALARVYGYESAAQMLAASANLRTLFVEPRRADDFFAAMEAQGEVSNFVAEMFCKSGNRFWISQHVRRVRPGRGQPEHYEGFVEDVTRHREMEAQVLRSQRMESIGTLAGGVAHDLNNIISPILMAVGMMREDPTTPEQKKMLALIELSAHRGAQIIKQVLTFGRGVEGERRSLPIGDLIKETLKMARETFPKDIVIESHVARELHAVVGDATQLQQVLLNLCVNARDAMPDGGRLQLRAGNREVCAPCLRKLPEAKVGQYVLLEVSDTGTGISPEIVERIFDPFFTTKEVGKGTGLGLSTVRGIVKSHGGCVNLVSKPGHGATFEVYLPATLEKCAPIPVKTAVKLPAGQNQMVLLADDEESIRVAVGTTLTMRGYRVITARDGAEALQIFIENADHIDLVLTDVTMPAMDGVELIHALRRMRPGLPVIASSGKGEKAVLAELQSIRTNAVLDKPYAAESLLRTVHRVLSEAAAAMAAPGVAAGQETAATR